MASLHAGKSSLTSHDRIFDRLVRRVVLPRLGIQAGQNASLHERLVEGHATSRHIRMLTVPGEEPRVIRALWRPLNPVRTGGRFDRFDFAAEMSRTAERAGLQVASVEHVFRGVDWPIFTQYWIALERYLENASEIRRQNREEVLAAFRTLGRLHSIRSETWGRLSARRDDYAQKRVAAWALRTAAKLPPCGLKRHRGALRDMVTAEARRMLESLPGSPFSLLHGDYKATNVLVRDGRPYLIDFLHAEYGLAGIEFMDALVHFCRLNNFANDAAAVYFDALDEELHPQFAAGEKLLLLLTTVYWLGKGKAVDPASLDVTPERAESWKPGLMQQGTAADWKEVVRAVLEGEIFRAGP